MRNDKSSKHLRDEVRLVHLDEIVEPKERMRQLGDFERHAVRGRRRPRC
jgi:hypothetical protein